MKKTIFLLMSSILGFAQQSIEVKLVNESIGSPFYNSMAGVYGNSSNDSGLNVILQNYNVLTYSDKGLNQADNLYYKAIQCNNCDLQNLKQDLINYNSVIASATISDYYTFDSTFIVKFINNSFITSINSSGGIIVTNDVTLNTIFQNHGVYLMNLAYSSQDTYYIKCNDCDMTALKAELDAYVSGIINTQYYTNQLVLSNDTFNKINTSIYPIPFQNELHIESEKLIKTYEVVDITGKTIINSTTKIEFNNAISQLNTGLYILQLGYVDGSNSVHKIIKN